VDWIVCVICGASGVVCLLITGRLGHADQRRVRTPNGLQKASLPGRAAG